MVTRNHIGKTIYVAAAIPATNDAAGFEALTWAKVAGLQVLPQFGVSHSNIQVPDLESGFTRGVKGAGEGMESTMTFADIGSVDPGQAIIQTASDGGRGLLSVKVVRGTGVLNAPVSGDAVVYAQGYAHSYMRMQGDTTTHEGFTAAYHQNDFTVYATQPV